MSALPMKQTLPEAISQDQMPYQYKDFKLGKGAQLGVALGNITMLVYAFRVKSGFWKGFLYVGLGGLMGMGLGTAIDKIIEPKNKTNPNVILINRCFILNKNIQQQKRYPKVK